MARLGELRQLSGGFLVTFIEREGHMEGTDLARAAEAVAAAGDARVTIAGGVTTAREVAALDSIGADAQVGMALYTGALTLGDAISGMAVSDRPDGLWPTVVVDEGGKALGLVYSSAESLSRAIEERRGIYHSRSRGVWRKGETSGATQELIGIALDCDRDTLRFTVRQHGPGFCHTGNDAALLAAKLGEEAAELAAAEGTEQVIHEAADLLYFLLVRATAEGASLGDLETELDRRELRVSRRPMVANEERG
jgi:phosphoribosyl-ATP pyrophosphohydrolase